jgi:hypothetical protein
VKLERKRLIGIGVAILVAVAGGGAAIAASGHHGSSSANRFGGFPGAGGPGFGGNAPNGAPPSGYGFRDGGFRGGGFGPGGDLRSAAGYLGISVQTLLSDLRSGKTLAQVADATSGKSSSGLVAALVAAGKTRIEPQVTAGRLTHAQADRIESGLQARVQAEVNGSFGGHDGFGRPGGDDDGPGFGPGPGGDDGGGGRAPTPTTTVPSTHI